MLLLIGVWIFFMRQMQSGGGKAMGFGKSKARMLTEKSGRVTFEDVAGIDEAKQDRITSYNVCYTKLLRCVFNSEYNRGSFLAEAEKLLARMPAPVPPGYWAGWNFPSLTRSIV